MPPSLIKAKRPAVAPAAVSPDTITTSTPPQAGAKPTTPQRKPPQLPPSNAATLAALRAGDKKTLTGPAPKEMQDKVGNGAVAAGLARGPGSDPKFAALKKDVAHKKRTIATSHPPAAKEATSAQEASVPPKDDAEAQGKTANAEKMNEAKPKEFDKEAFIKAVEKAIAEKAPKNLEQADEFAESGKPAEVKAEVAGKVGEGKTDSAEQIATTTAAPPDTSGAVTKQVVPLSPDRPPGTPATPDPAKATPEKLPPSATDMSAGPKAVNQEMTDAQITEPQLKKANEPTFTTALKDKKTAEHHSETTPPELRKHEATQLSQTTAQAKHLGMTAMGAMAGRRVRTGQHVGTGKTNTKSSDEEKRAQVTAILQKVFDTMKTDVEGILTGLDKLVDDQFTKGEKEARDAFTAEHRRKMDAYKDKRYSGKWGWTKWGHDKLLGLPDEANQIFVEARDNYVKRMRQVISDIADTIGRELTRAKQRIAKGRTDLHTEVAKLPKDLQTLGKQAAADFSAKFDELTQSVDDKSTELVDTLATKYTDAVKAVDEEIAAEKEKNKPLVDKALDGIKDVVKTINDLKNMLLGVLAKASQAVMGILKDPIGFLGNLVKAVGGGLKLFKNNAKTHLQQGVLSWLLGTAATAGIQLPTTFDIVGILLLIASLLGLTWPAIRARIAKKVPKEAMTAIEAGEHALPIVLEVRKRGVRAMWDDLKTRVGDLKKNLIDNLVQFLLPTIIIAGITWIISLFNPASAFIRACKMIIDIIRFIVTNGRQIIEFVNTVLDAVIAISKGGGGGVPGLVEKALARSVPVLIGALAALLGVGGIAGKVKQIFQELAKPVGKAIDWVIDKIVGLAKKIWAKIKALAKKAKDKLKALGKKVTDKFERKKKPGDKPRKPLKDRLKEKLFGGDKEERLRKALDAAVRAANRFQGRVFRAVALKPVLTGIRLRYHLTELRLEQGEKVWSVYGAASPGMRRKTKIPVKPEDAAADANAKNVFAAELAQTHRKARPAILKALRGLKELVASGNWANAKNAMQQRDSTVKLMESKPLLQKEHQYGDWTHERAAKATLSAMRKATAPGADDAEAKKVAASVRRFGGGRIGLPEASTYLADHKGEVHKPGRPFDTAPAPVELFREAIWNSAQMPAALTRIEETMLARLKTGGSPEPQTPLPNEIRREVLRKLRRATLRVTTEGSGADAEVRIQLTPKKADEITGYLAAQAAAPGVDPKLKDALLWWEKYVLQSEWHHAWPQWLGGAENQTKICFPKMMHNFDGITTEQGKFPVGFHQHLNAKIKATFGEAFSINDARGWADYRRVTPGAVAKMGTLIIDSYENVFKRFRAKDEAKNKFVSEAESELTRLLATRMPT